MAATQTTLTEGTHLFGSPEFDLLRRLFDVRERAESSANGSSYTSIAPRLFRAEQVIDGHEAVADMWASSKLRVVCPDGAQFDAKFELARRGPGADFYPYFYTRDDLWDGSAFTLTRLHTFDCPCGAERLRTWAPVYPQQRERAICRECGRAFDAVGVEIRGPRLEISAPHLFAGPVGGPRPAGPRPGPRPGQFGPGAPKPAGAS